jgi:hypothetical protein
MKPKQNDDSKDQTPTTDESPKLASTSSNPFDLGKLKLSQDFDSMGGGVKKLLTTIPVKKPNRQAFIRAFGPDFQVTTAVVELKGEQDGTFLVAPELRDELMDEINIVHLVTCVDRAGNYFLWPIKMAKAGERSNPWHESALLALEHAEKRWVRVSANMGAGHYDVFTATSKLSDPVEPDLTLQKMIETAFRGKLIDSADHPVVKKLRGEE